MSHRPGERSRAGVRWGALCLFTGAATWSLAAAVDMRRVYQDSWLLEGLWLPIGLALAAYVVSAVHLRRPRHVALLATGLAVLLNAVPALKYAYPYAPTSDTADHILLIRALVATGQADPSSAYQHTPGLHLLVAALSGWSGTLLWLWARLFPPLLGALLPLGFYLLCARLPLPAGMARPVLALSPFALPLLYALNGTSFTAPLLVAMLALVLVRESGTSGVAEGGDPSLPALRFTRAHGSLPRSPRPVHSSVQGSGTGSALPPRQERTRGSMRAGRGPCTWEVGHTILLLLLAGAIIFWHPISSLLYPMVLLGAGLLGQLRPACRRACAASGALASLGASMAAAVLAFWVCRAGYVWDRLLKNLRLLLAPWHTPALVPTRLGELDLAGQARMALFFHGRDVVLLGLAACGVFFLAWSLARHSLVRPLRAAPSTVREGPVDQRSRLRSPYAAHPRPLSAARRALYTYSLVWLLFGAVVCGVFAYRFGAQGYQRFLLYLVTLSPLPAGYALWRGSAALRRALARDRPCSERAVVAVALSAAAILSCCQLYPYQPAVPAIETGTDDAAPAVWLHLANSEYQRQLLRYAAEGLPPDAQLVVDYAGHRQARLFSGTALQDRLRRTEQARPAPAFLLLHWPGPAGPYMEQAEFRSRAALQAWRDRRGVSTLYDNGGAFILYHPANAVDPYRLEASRE